MCPPITRRRLLSLGGGAGTAALAGCFSFANDGDDVCTSGYRDLGDAFENRSITTYLRYASLDVPQSIPAGERFEATLSNESTDPLVTLGKPRYAIQRLSPDGEWRTTVGVPEDHEWSPSRHVLDPGESLRWEMALSFGEFAGPFERCTSHTPATYRFVYWGFSEHDAGVALAAPFEIVE